MFTLSQIELYANTDSIIEYESSLLNVSIWAGYFEILRTNAFTKLALVTRTPFKYLTEIDALEMSHSYQPKQNTYCLFKA